MNLGRRLLPFVWLFGTAAGAQALEWEVDSVSSANLQNIPSPPSGLTQEFLGSLSLPFDPKGGGFEAKAHGLVGARPSEGYADFDVLAVTLAFQRPGSGFRTLETTLGRFALTEPTGLILYHPGDGAKFILDFDGFGLTAAVGYTGLVNRSSSGILLTVEDSAHSSDLFASRRLIGSLETTLPVFSQTLTAGALFQYDLNPSSDLLSSGTTTESSTQGGTLNTQYFTLKAGGPVADRLFYEAFGTLGTGSTLSWVSGSYQYEPILSGLAGASLTYYFPGDWAAALKLRFLGATGDTSATSAIEGNVTTRETLFLPVTPTTLGDAFNPGLSNLLYYEVGGTVKPFVGKEFQAGLKVLGFQRATDGVVNAAGFTGSGSGWLGTEADLTVSWAPVSDAAFSASAGGFFPTGQSFEYAVTFGVTLGL